MIDVFFDDRVLDHDTGLGLWEHPATDLLAVPELHPENAERVRNMESVLKRGPVAQHLSWHGGRPATVEELTLVHDRSYVEAVLQMCRHGGGRIDSSTVLSGKSEEPILVAAGCVLEAGAAVLSEKARIAYAMVRPPGHHAQPAQADGYCFFNHAALVAELARRAGVSRVAIVDWDVHHGNGNQECFWSRDDVLTCSLHMRTGSWGPTHTQTGSPEEMGVGAGKGYNINVELGIGAGDRAYIGAFENIVLPILRQYRPGLIVGSCGQDASAFDANGRQNVSMAGFHGIGDAMRRGSDELCDGKLVLVQEGGYARTYAGYCLHATLEGALGIDPPLLEEAAAYIPDDIARAHEMVLSVQSALERHWEFPSSFVGRQR
jgi:acetoin utilization deacetylase AcuC-like enzyme